MDIPVLCLLVMMMVGVLSPLAGSSKCTYSRERKMMVANCVSRNYIDIPKLRTDIEILHAEYNRIRTLTNSSLRDYTSLKYLYLQENFIKKIEEGAFSELDELEVLDLTENGVIIMPSVLPLSLRKLSLTSNNGLQNLSLSAAFNLNFLSLAMCDLKYLPPLGMLPNLKELNLTGNNQLKNVTPSELAPLCRLERVLLPRGLYQQTDQMTRCHCLRLLTWASDHDIELPSFNCSSQVDFDVTSCDLDFHEERRLHKYCLVAMPSSTNQTLLFSVLGGAALLTALILVCWWRKSRRKKNSVQDQKNSTRPKCLNAKAVDTLIT